MVNELRPYKETITNLDSLSAAIEASGTANDTVNVKNAGNAVSSLITSLKGALQGGAKTQGMAKSISDLLVSSAASNVGPDLTTFSTQILDTLHTVGAVNSDGSATKSMKVDRQLMRNVGIALSNNHSLQKVAIPQVKNQLLEKAAQANKLEMPKSLGEATAKVQEAIKIAKSTPTNSAEFPKAFTNLVNIARTGGHFKSALVAALSQESKSPKQQAVVHSTGEKVDITKSFGPRLTKAIANLNKFEGVALQKLHVVDSESSLSKANSAHLDNLLNNVGTTDNEHVSSLPGLAHPKDRLANNQTGLKEAGLKDTTAKHESQGEVFTTAGYSAFHAVVSFLHSDNHFDVLLDPQSNHIAVAGSPKSPEHGPLKANHVLAHTSVADYTWQPGNP